MSKKHERLEEAYVKEMEDIKRARITIGKDKPNKSKSIGRLGLGIIRHKYWQDIKRDLIAADLPEEKKIRGYKRR